MVNLAQNIKPFSYMASHPDEVITQVSESGAPMVITQGGEAKLVVIDVQQYQRMVDTINLLRILSLGEADVEAGRFCSTEDMDSKFFALLDK
jgi:PHD/YefM family antitoxin component YafN of YafNO toxin-antitoxin module